MKNKKLKFSLVIPVFNEEDYIGACLSAVAAQTILPDEVIVVDNGSTDRTRDIVGEFAFVKLLSEPRRGVQAARDKGYRIAKGDLIGRIDADTILPPRWTENIIRAFKKGGYAAVTGPVGYYDMPFPASNHYPDHLMRSSIYNWSPKSPFLFGSNMAIRRQTWLAVKPKLCGRRDIHEDLDLAVHLYQSGERILYDKTLLAGASGRRYNDKPAQFASYMSMYRRTYLSHGLHSLAGYAAVAVYWLGYVVVHPVRSAYFNLYASVKPQTLLALKSRKNPMQR